MKTIPNAMPSHAESPFRDEQHQEDERAVGVALVHRVRNPYATRVDAARPRISVRGRGSRRIRDGDHDRQQPGQDVTRRDAT